MSVKFLCLCAFVLFYCVNPTQAQAVGSHAVPATVTPKIQSVELYPSGARFIFAVKAPAGNVQLELPGAFNESSVRVLSPEGLEGLQAIRRSRPDWVPPSLVQLKEDYDAQQKKVAQLTARELSLSQTIKLLGTLHPGKEQTGAGELITYIKEAQVLKLNTENEIAELRPELEREKEKLSLLKDELDRRAPYNANSWLDVTGRMTDNATKEVLFEARTNCANWEPHYRMNLDSATGAIHAQLYASVEQSTGLDYTGKILFHTRVPDDNVRAPRLEPLRVYLAPKKEAARAAGSMSMKNMAAAPMMAMADMAAVMEEAEAVDDYMPAPVSAARFVREAITLTDRAVDGAGALPGDRSRVQFELGEINWTCVPEFMLIPEQQKDAWILASIDQSPDNNANTRDLIPGMAELFVDGAPAGQTNIPEYGLEQMKLPFGRVALLTAKKEPLVSTTGSSWFSGDSVARGYKIKITNGTDTDKTVTVRDRLPISTVDKVKLEVRKIDPEPFERDKENRLTWKLDIKAGETVEILVDYTLNYPSGETLQYR